MNSRSVLVVGLVLSMTVSSISVAKNRVEPDASQIYASNLSAWAAAAHTSVEEAQLIRKSMKQIASDLRNSRTPFDRDLSRIQKVLDEGGSKTFLLYSPAIMLPPCDLRDRVDRAAWESMKSSNQEVVAQAAHYIGYFKPAGWRAEIEANTVLSSEYKALLLR